MKSSLLTLGLALIFVAPFAAQAGEACLLLPTWQSVPGSVRASLSQDMGPIAERGEPFESTDALGATKIPRNRFFGACTHGSTLVVAIERGGIGYSLEVIELVNGKKAREWYHSLPSGPFTPAFAVPPAQR